MNKFYALLLIVVFSSCRGTRLNYLGSSLAPTSDIDIYVDASAIKRPYTIIGKGYMEYANLAKSRVDKMQKKAVEKAKSQGADAVLFQDYIIKRDGTNVQTVTKTDSVGKGLVTVETGMIGPVISSGTNILFLKYN